MCLQNLLFENVPLFPSTFVHLGSHQHECMCVCHTFQGWGSIRCKRVHTIVKNSGIRTTSLWNPKQTWRGSRPVWLKLTNHPEAPVRPRAAQNPAPGNGCLNIYDVICGTLCMCAYTCWHMYLHEIISPNLDICKVWVYTAHTHTQTQAVFMSNILYVHVVKCGQKPRWLTMYTQTSPGMYCMYAQCDCYNEGHLGMCLKWSYRSPFDIRLSERGKPVCAYIWNHGSMYFCVSRCTFFLS